MEAVYDEETEIESVNELDNLDEFESSPQVKQRDIYSKKDLPYRKQYCTFYGCEAYFFVRWHLERHLRKHNGEKPFICTQTDECEKAFTCRSYLNKHIRQVHETTKKPPRVRKNYPCPQCDKVFKQKYNLKVHLCAVHTGEKPFSCDQCDKAFTNASRLLKHSKTHDGYACNREACDFVATKWTELQKHIAQNHKETFICSICEKKFNERYALTTHLKIHSGERLACTYENCSRSYSNIRNLKTHLRIDHQGQRFSCTYAECSDKTFKYKSSLTKHIAKVHLSTQKTEKLVSPIFTHRVSCAAKLTGIEGCEQEIKKILLEDKIYRSQIVAN